MKMKKGFLNLFSFVGIVIASLVFLGLGSGLAGENRTTYATDEPTTAYGYLLNGTTPYLSNIASTDLGTTDGYGKFVVGASDIKLSATASTGYTITGWYVQYGTSNTLYLATNSNLTDDDQDETWEYTIPSTTTKFSITFSDADSDGYVDGSALILSEVSEDMSISPVYDYIYYSVDITDFFDILAVDTDTNSVTIGDNTMYYSASETDVYTKYSDAIVKDADGKYYFYGDVYGDGADGYYTLHTTAEASSNMQYIAISRGAYRLEDMVEIGYGIKNSTSLTSPETININLTAINLTAEGQTSSLTLVASGDFGSADTACYYVEQDEYMRSTELNIKCAITDTTSKILTLGAEYDNLYLVTIKLQVDGVDLTTSTADTAIKKMLLDDGITISNTYYPVVSATDVDTTNGDAIYFVRTSESNNGDTFRVSCATTISKSIDGVTYQYYNFASIDDASTNPASYTTITDNFTVTINYASVLYSVSFEFLLWDGTSTTASAQQGSFNLKETIQISRGQSTGDISDPTTNIGYTFYAFSLTTTVPGSANTTISTTIDEEKPQNKTIYMIYTYTEYTVTIYGINSISLTDTSSNTIYALSKIDLAQLKGATTSTYTAYDSDLTGLTSYTFSTKFTINDVINLTATVNNGFVISGYNYGSTTPAELYVEGATFTISLTSSFLGGTNVSTTNDIAVYIVEAYQTYTLSYYIEAASDTHKEADADPVIMADLTYTASDGTDFETAYAYATATATYTYESGGETYTTIDFTTAVSSGTNVKYVITFTGLRLYDALILSACGKTDSYVSGQETYNYTYSFTRFTSNDRLNLSSTYNGTTNTYSFNAVMEGDLSVKVVYSMPIARLIVSIKDGYDGAFSLQDGLGNYNYTISYTTEEGGSTVTKYAEIVDNIAELSSGLSITLTIDPTKMSFGYSFAGISLLQTNSGSAITGTDGSAYGFKITMGSEATYIQLNFNLIEYYFYFTQSVEVSTSGFDFDGDGTADEYKLVTVQDLGISFTMPTGYYVSIVTLGGVEYLGMAQTNAYSSNVFNFTFTVDTLATLVDALIDDDYVTTVTQDDGKVYSANISAVVTYAIHTYTITIKYGLSNPKDTSADYRVTYPTITLTYDGCSGEITGTKSGTTLTFTEAVPYGATNVKLSAGSVQTGLNAYGWTDANGNRPYGYDYSSTQLTISTVTQDYSFMYKLSYTSYTINLTIDVSLLEAGTSSSTVADPSLSVNGTTNNKVTLYDYLSIDPNANSTNGYVFSYLYYYAYEYCEYDYSDADTPWETYWNSVYTYTVLGGYVLNTSETYSASTTYYEYKLVTKTFSDGTIYADSDFNITNYYLGENGYVNIYLVYDYLQLTIVNYNTNYSGTLYGVGDLEISTSDYSSFAVYVDGYLVEDLTSTTVTILNTVEIYITLKSVTLDQVSYDLSSGLELRYIYFPGATASCSFTGSDGSYYFSFKVADVLSYGNFTSDGTLTINYQYAVKNVTITYTTNISSADFYEEDGTFNFNMVRDEYTYGFGTTTGYANGDSYVASALQFLGKADFGYEFSDSYENYFQIKSIKVYLSTGALVDEADYAKYGIMVNYASGYVDTITVRFISSLTIKLQVTPIIIFNTEEIDGDGNYWFRSEFDCDSYGYGINQYLTIGSSASYDIQAADFVLNFLTTGGDYNISYYNTNGIATAPCDAGTYTVKLTFNSTGDYDWLSELELDYGIYFVITPKVVYITYNDTATKLTKTYDGTSNYDIADLLQYLIITDNNGFSIYYLDENTAFALSTNYAVKITYTYNLGETEAIDANESSYYNLYLTGLELTSKSFNNNFSLQNSTLVMESFIKILKKELTITGFAVADKVYDGTTKAELSGADNVRLYGVVIRGDVKDDVYLNLDITVAFESSSIGANKNISVNSLTALAGEDASNYYVTISAIKASIYPYSVSVVVDGYGTITVRNDRGLTDATYASLIPIGVSLQVSVIEQDEYEYRNLYQYFSSLLSNNEQFVVGYKLSFLTSGGLTTSIDKNLYVVVPNVERVMSAISLTGEVASVLTYTTEDDNLVIDLSQVSLTVDTLLLTQQRVLFTWWQITIIVALVGTAVGLGVTVFVVVRKRKERSYRVHDKI